MEWETVEPKSRPRRSKKQDEYFKVMTEYKTVECKKKHKTIEEQFECFYWHNDKEKRRSPPGLYSANEEDKCHLYDSGKCKDPLCKHWHSKFEQLYHPKKYKGKKCVKEPQNRCPRKSILCAYQHHDDEPIEEWVWREALYFVHKHLTVPLSSPYVQHPEILYRLFHIRKIHLLPCLHNITPRLPH